MLTLVTFVSVGESVDDCGGGYSESVAEICEELQSPHQLMDLLIPTPNGRDEAGTSRDCYIVNPEGGDKRTSNAGIGMNRLR